MVLPFVMRKLDLKTMLACRLVDKSTKLAVDTTLRNDLTSPEGCYKVIGFLPRNDTEYYNELSNLQDAFIFLNNRKAEKFMGMVGDNGQNNPIIGGKLSYRVGACLEKAKNDSFMSLDCFESLLKRFGEHVSHLKVTLAKCRRHSSVDNEKISIEKIVSLLVHLPNVEVLALDSTKEVIKVDKIEKQFPQMNKLRYIQFEENLSNTIILPFVSHYGHHLTILDCEEVLFTAQDISASALKLLLPHVRKVCVDKITSDGLQKLSSVDWALTHFRILSFNKRKRPTWEEFVSSISGLKDTLIELEILDHVCFCRTKVSNNISKVTFPKLKCVIAKSQYLYMYGDKFNDFLRNCPCLCELKIHLRRCSFFKIQRAKLTLVKVPRLKMVGIWRLKCRKCDL